MRPENYITDEEIRRSCVGGYERQCPECDTDMDSRPADPEAIFCKLQIRRCPECGHQEKSE